MVIYTLQLGKKNTKCYRFYDEYWAVGCTDVQFITDEAYVRWDSFEVIYCEWLK